MRIGLGFRLTNIIKFPNNENWKDQYRFRIDGWNTVVLEYPEQSKWEDYNGWVHCVTVPNGTVVVRRGWKTAVSGNSGMFQNKVIAKTVDNVSRAVIIPDPNLDMDHIGLPEESAWASYKDFIARRLTRRGYPLVKALELIKDKAPVAKDALIQEMQVRPVIIDRAPTWHKFNLVSLWPTLVEGTSMRMPPLVTPPMGGDYDGDTLNFHVPVTDKAVEEAIRKMMPSKNLFGTTGLTEPRYTPKMEFIMGLYHLTKKPSNKPVKVFPNVAAAKEAYRKGEIMGNDPIEILSQKG